MAAQMVKRGLEVDHFRIELDKIRALPGFSPVSVSYDNAYNVVGTRRAPHHGGLVSQKRNFLSDEPSASADTTGGIGAAQFVFCSPSGSPALRRPSTMRAYCALKVGSSVQWMPAQVCTVKPG
jgi:hypothetical protein